MNSAFQANDPFFILLLATESGDWTEALEQYSALVGDPTTDDAFLEALQDGVRDYGEGSGSEPWRVLRLCQHLMHLARGDSWIAPPAPDLAFDRAHPAAARRRYLGPLFGDLLRIAADGRREDREGWILDEMIVATARHAAP
jgi:hypothetical protein